MSLGQGRKKISVSQEQKPFSGRDRITGALFTADVPKYGSFFCGPVDFSKMAAGALPGRGKCFISERDSHYY